MQGYFNDNIRGEWMKLRSSLGIKTISVIYENEDVHIPVKRFNPMDGTMDDLNTHYPPRQLKTLEELLAEPAPF